MFNKRFIYYFRKKTPELIFILASIPALAAQTGDMKKIVISGKLIGTTQCSINNNRQIDVSFGNVSISKVDNNEFIMPINYTVDCINLSTNNTIIMTFLGTPSSFDTHAMATSINQLGAKILKNGEPIELNKGFNISLSPQKPDISVQLIKDPTRDLPEGPFYSTGTMIIEFF